MRKKVLTGIKPTGFVHIGNYFGAIKPAIELSNKEENDSYFFIADYHALTTLENKKDMQTYLYNVACTWLACGLNPDKVVFYKQSDIPEIFELSWILCNVTPKGLMNRAHAYKACVDANEREGVDVDSGINMGLYNYPILMAADILCFETDFVPVGLDQKQHVEIARDIAVYFNNKYGKTFNLPTEIIDSNVSTLVGLDGRKMSKSYNNIIQLFTTEEQLKKSVNKIITDSKLPGEPKGLDCTVNKLYKLFAEPNEIAEFETKLENGLGWGDAKKELFFVMNRYIAPLREKFNYYMNNKNLVDEIFNKGKIKAQNIAKNIIKKVRENIGVN